MLADSTNAEVPGSTKSETEIGRVLEEVFREQEGRRIITASFASHLHRVQQIANAALATNRKIATLRCAPPEATSPTQGLRLQED